ncbi:MAG: glycoside hydrolase family 2 TIM barrel-domain containing protein [Bacteroidota bacterium]|nr:glycoside hydrolase family 2 TIM barrel-domain containing protein [Bacteroidota bacterium]
MNRIKIIIVLSLFLKFSLSAAPATQIRQKVLFNSDWKFKLGDSPEFRDSILNDTSWRNLSLPHDWSIEGDFDKSTGTSGGFFPIGFGWYRKSFTLPESMINKQIVIQFDGIYMNSDIWINGHFLGHYPYGYTTFQYDLTKFINENENAVNTIAVRVDNSLNESTRWYTGSGIYRNVWLIATNFVHFDNSNGVFVTTPEANKEKAVVKIAYNFVSNFFSTEEFNHNKRDIWYSNPQRKVGKLLFRSTIINKHGDEIGRTETEKECINYTSINQLNQQIEISNPKLWSIDSPAIYSLKSEILIDGQLVDDQITSFGIRKLEYIKDKGLFVNGKSEKLKGVCVHQDMGSFGTAVPIQVWHQRLMKLKEMGCNALRTAHHPFAPEFYDLCDSIGFYVMDEAFDEWTKGWSYDYTANNQGKAPNGYHLYFNQWSETDLRTMLQRDRNHPSIVMYSIGNEIPDQKDAEGYKTVQRLVNICHTEDNTRPVTSGCDQYMDATNNGFIDALDISGYNYIDRHFKEKMYEQEHTKRLDKLCVGTETGKSAQNFVAYRDNDYVVGGFVWIGLDYLGESKKYPERGWTSALIDIAGFEKPEYYLYKSFWSNKPTVKLAIQQLGKRKSSIESKWNWESTDSLKVNIYSNCDQVELLLNNQSFGKKNVDKNTYTASWPLIYKAGTIKAVGYNANKKVTEDVLQTSFEATKMVARISKNTLLANGEDFSFIEITIVDKNGISVVDASNSITVNVTGAGSLEGIDTGNMSYLGIFKTNIREAYKGKLLLTVKSSELEGKIFVELKSEKIDTLKFNLFTKNQ